jgi:predicted nucleic acid-binding protein
LWSISTTSSASCTLAERTAVNASPLIYLSRAGLIQLLQLVGAEIVVPLAVAQELRRRGPEDPAVRALDTNPWLVVIETPPVSALIQKWDLGPGESAVLAYAHSAPGTLAILDDLAARRCAGSLGIPIRGTLGLVLLAKQRGVIPAARPALDVMRLAGMYLSDAVMNQALAMVGE